MTTDKLTIEQFDTILRDVVTSLGEDYSLNVNPERYITHASIHHISGYEVSVYANGVHLEFSPRWLTLKDVGYFKPYKPTTQTILISSAKPAAQIAKELRRRFLTTYDREWTEQKARADECVRVDDEQKAKAKHFAGLLGDTWREHAPYEASTPYGSNSYRIEVKVKARAVTVAIEHIPTDVAEGIITFLKEAHYAKHTS